ncbi:hypothetical protein ES708_06186 [subsurface metagenome]
MNDTTLLEVTGVVCITVLTSVAMFVTGHNGTILAAGCTAIGAIIGGIAGYTYKEMKK